MKNKTVSIGLKDVAPSQEAQGDKNCPFYGKNRVRGSLFTGTVVKTGSQKTATVMWERLYFLPKYERHEKRRTKVLVHNPPSIDAKVGDTVVIAQCKPMSKTKHFVIVEKK